MNAAPPLTPPATGATGRPFVICGDAVGVGDVVGVGGAQVGTPGGPGAPAGMQGGGVSQTGAADGPGAPGGLQGSEGV